MIGENTGFGTLQHAFDPAENGKREHCLGTMRWPKCTKQNVGPAANWTTFSDKVAHVLLSLMSVPDPLPGLGSNVAASRLPYFVSYHPSILLMVIEPRSPPTTPPFETVTSRRCVLRALVVMNSDVSVPSVYGNACPGSFRPKNLLARPVYPCYICQWTAVFSGAVGHQPPAQWQVLAFTKGVGHLERS